MVQRRPGKEGGETGRDISSPLGAQFTAGSPHQCLAPCPAAAGSKDGLGPWLCPPPPPLESYSLGGRKAGLVTLPHGDPTAPALWEPKQGLPPPSGEVAWSRCTWGASVELEHRALSLFPSQSNSAHPCLRGAVAPSAQDPTISTGGHSRSIHQMAQGTMQGCGHWGLLLHMEPPVCSCSSD